MSLAQTAARGAVVTIVGQFLRFLVQMIALAVLARLLTPQDFGVFAMVYAIVGVATVLGDFGLSMASIQAQNLTNEQRNNLFWTNAAIGSTLCAIIILLSQVIADFYDRPELVHVAQIISITFLLSSLTTQFRAEISSELRFRCLATSDIFAQVGGLSVAVAMAILGGGYWALVGQQVTVAAITLIMLAIGANWLPGRPSRGASMRSLYTFGANTLGVQLINYATSNLDNVLIGRFGGPNVLGFYNRASQLYRIPLSQVAGPMTRVAMPVLSRIQHQNVRYESYLQRGQLILSYTFGGIFFVMAALNDPLVDIILGEQWQSTKEIFVILAIGGVFQSLGYIYYWIFLSRAMTGIQLRYSVIGRGSMLIALCIGVQWGTTGVAVAASSGQLFMWLLNSLFGAPKAGINAWTLIRIGARPVIVYTGMVALVLPVSSIVLADWNPWVSLTVTLPLIAMYLGAVLALAPAVRRDVGLIVDAARRIRR